MKSFSKRLQDSIDKHQNPTVMGLDPLIDYVPDSIRNKYMNSKLNAQEATGSSIYEFNVRLMDCVKGIIPAIKPQLAYYEKLGVEGIKCFNSTIKYAKENDFIVITDGKRNDILSTATCYSDAYLGKSKLIDNTFFNPFDTDALTINPYLGFDGISPFIENCIKYGKGIFILVRTSNPSAIDIQDIKTSEGVFLYEHVAKKVNGWGKAILDDNGYSSVGAVVGATWPQQAQSLRKIMKEQIILVPGYGAQGGGGKEAAMSFNNDKKGAIVNASRSLICAYKKDEYTHEEFEKATREEALRMKTELNTALNTIYND